MREAAKSGRGGQIWPREATRFGHPLSRPDVRGSQISLSFLPTTSGRKRGEASRERRGGWPAMVNDDGDTIGGGGHGGGNGRGGGKWWIEEEDKEFTLRVFRSFY
ncbi:hypothetical protein Syun_022070 [Stephania yunnanensis]|uniref:Uncharacterized protein n=1 Tax=Stephania yunnanensis TaxID=152371 RepID=A0AAP0IGY0_9MAGN